VLLLLVLRAQARILLAVSRGAAAVRAVLGAGRSRSFASSSRKACCWRVCGTVGLGFAFVGVRAIVALAPADLPRSMRFGSTVGVMFAFAVTAVIGIVVGLAPALRARGPARKAGFECGRAHDR
jgi:hypothetical protein